MMDSHEAGQSLPSSRLHSLSPTADEKQISHASILSKKEEHTSTEINSQTCDRHLPSIQDLHPAARLQLLLPTFTLKTSPSGVELGLALQASSALLK